LFCFQTRISPEMILDKPLSVGHFGERDEVSVIYSVDVHPDGSRFATGGGDSRVKIWSMAPFSDRASAPVKIVGSQLPSRITGEEVTTLAVLSQHTGSVQCVRWSHDGMYLASGSDDTFLFVWELRQGAMSSAPFGSHDKPNKENWTRVWTLRGHTMDVLDCAWSPRGSLLASCSIDNHVIVWKIPNPTGAVGGSGWGASRATAGTMLNPLKVLKGHSSWVKGVSWDPMGRYLSSIGEDNCLLVWRVWEWKVEATITKHFQKCEETLVRNLTWSPDGYYLAATNSKSADQHVVVVLTRGKWLVKPTFLVGHTAPTLAASFSRNMYRRIGPPYGKEKGGKEKGDKEKGGKEKGDKEKGDKEKGGKEKGDKEKGDKEKGCKEKGGKEK
ncbi:unnamed protein product, partial [Discosporangium mesarthrocarpum]